MIKTDTSTAPPSVSEAKIMHHIVERLGGPDSIRFKPNALCGAKVTRIFLEHSEEICQECVDLLRGRSNG